MLNVLRRKFILFSMSAVTLLLLTLVGAINGFSWMILEEQTNTILHTLAAGENSFPQPDSHARPPFAPSLTLDTLQAARFFMVHVDADGNVADVNVDQISSVSATEAAEYAGQVNQESGKIGIYKYEVKPAGKESLIFFVDVSGQKSVFAMVLVVSSGIALACWLIVLLFVFFASGKIVRPVLAGMEKQKQFITNAGHELKTPLAIIQSNNDAMMLIHGENKYNANIRVQTQRLNALMSNLLTLAKLDEDVKLPTAAVPVSSLIAGMLPVYREIASEKQIVLLANLQPDVFLQAHQDTLAQLVTVLLDNAVKYTPTGGEIRLSLSSEGNRVWLTEENDCDPAHENDPERLFERFYRGDSARTQSDSASGYGVGLSAARAIAEAFGGKLTASYPAANRIRFTARF